nr:phage holin family protein [Bordetella sp. 02P26C-1]
MAIPVLTVVAHLLATGRLICYRRGCARYRPFMSVLAYLLIVFSGGQALDIIFNAAPVTPWDAGLSVVIAALVWRSRGNVSALLRGKYA